MIISDLSRLTEKSRAALKNTEENIFFNKLCFINIAKIIRIIVRVEKSMYNPEFSNFCICITLAVFLHSQYERDFELCFELSMQV